jgi:hypothetical protein
MLGKVKKFLNKLPTSFLSYRYKKKVRHFNIRYYYVHAIYFKQTCVNYIK